MATPAIDMEKIFRVFDESAIILKDEMQVSYLEALAETGGNLFEHTILQDVNEFTEKRLMKLYETITLHEIPNEQIRKALQLTILKGMKEAIQPTHEMTPDAICLFISYLVEKLTYSKEAYSLLDLAYGTGNLVTAILNQTRKKVTAYGVEVDDTLLKLGYVSANLQRHEIELFRQDALQPIFVEEVDLVVSDLPVGYYPNEVVAKDYQLNVSGGQHPFIQNLYIEKGLKELKEGGFLVAMIPNFIFEGEEAKALHTYLKENAVIIGLLQLPLTMFKNEKYAKSIFLLQKKGQNVQTPRQALLVDLPSFSKKEAMTEIIGQIDNWFKSNLLL